MASGSTTRAFNHPGGGGGGGKHVKHVKNKSSSATADQRQQQQQQQAGKKRNIEVQQNWLARLFRVKPATRYLCFAIARRQARQEIALLLREWRKYGIRDVQVDKGRNIIFARLSKNNCKCLSPPSLPPRPRSAAKPCTHS